MIIVNELSKPDQQRAISNPEPKNSRSEPTVKPPDVLTLILRLRALQAGTIAEVIAP